MNRRDEIIFIGSLVGRKDIFLKQTGGSYIRASGMTTERHIKAHLDNKITIGSYPIYFWNKSSRCAFIAIDIDAHVSQTQRTAKFNKFISGINSKVFENDNYLISKIPSKASIVDKSEKERLRKKVELLYSRSNTFFLCDNKHIVIEETTGGFHFWIPLSNKTLLKDAWIYLQAIRAKILFYTKMYKSGKKTKRGILSRDTEFYPTISADNLTKESFKEVVGKGIKFPIAFDQKFRRKTKITHYKGLHKLDIKPIVRRINKFMSNFDYRNKLPTESEIINITPPKRYNKRKINKELKKIENNPFMPYCIRKIISGELKPEGNFGHKMRVCVANELLSYGLEPEIVAMAFKNQEDFDFIKSYKYVIYSKRKQEQRNSDMCCRCQTIANFGYCLSECPRLGGTSNKLKEKKQIDGVHSWDELSELIEEVLFNENGVYVIKKTTRSGATTEVVDKSIQLGYKILVVGPTKKIYDNTVKEAIDIGLERGMFNRIIKTYRVKSNFGTCKLLTKDLTEEEVKRIKKIFPFVLKPQCKKCKEFENCSYQHFIKNMDSYDLIYITTAKLKAMINSPESGFLLEKLVNWSNVVFIDECSHLFTINYDAKIILDAEEEIDNINKSFNAIDKFLIINKKYIISEIFDIFMDFLVEIRNIVINEFIPETYNKFVSFSDLNRRFSIYINEHPNSWTKIYSLLFNYFKKTKSNSVKYLIWIFLALSSRDVYLQQIITLEGFRKVILASVDDINKLVFYIRNIARNKLIVMTDALLPPIDLKKIYPNLHYVNVNDPNNSAKSQTVIIIKDTDPFFKVSTRYAPKKVEKELIKFFQDFAKDKAFMIVKSKKVDSFVNRVLEDSDIEFETKDWYRGENTIGTKSDLRLMLVLGSPQPPSHVYDYIAYAYRKLGYLDKFDSDEEAGKYFENYSAKSAFIQGISRAKDPKGKEKSYVLIYGIPESVIRNYLDVDVAMPEIETFDKEKHKFLLR